MNKAREKSVRLFKVRNLLIFDFVFNFREKTDPTGNLNLLVQMVKYGMLTRFYSNYKPNKGGFTLEKAMKNSVIKTIANLFWRISAGINELKLLIK